MADPAFKYTDATQRVVVRTLSDGRMESHTVDATAYHDWVAKGNSPLAADPAAPVVATVTVDALAAALIAKGVLGKADVTAAVAAQAATAELG